MKSFTEKTTYIFTLLMLISASLFSCGENEGIVAREGFSDLRDTDSLRNVSIDLKGDFAFFWNEFTNEQSLSEYEASNADTFIHVPAYWEPHVRGYGIYSLRILLPEDLPEQLAFKMTNVLENYSLFVNGKLLHQVGQPGITVDSAVRESKPALIPFSTEADYLDVVFQVSVWHDVSGGLSRNLYFGDYQTLRQNRERGLALDAIIIGAVMIIGFYHLMVFGMMRFDRKNLSALFLGLVFILVVLFLGSKDELLFSTLLYNFSAVLRVKFIYSSLAVSVPLFFCYIHYIFPDYLSKIVFRIVLGVSSTALLTIIFSEAAFFTRLLIPLEVFSLTVSVHVIGILILNLIRKKKAIIMAFLAGYLLLVAGVIFAMLDNFMMVPAWSPGVLFLFFTVYQTSLQAYNTSSAYRKITKLNESFIEMEKETEKLYDLSYVDQLTSLANRRFLNEYMQKLWERNSMTGIDVGMIIFDIDYFKLYNDRYGHLAGDTCLMKVAASLRDSMNRKGDFIARYGGEEFVAIIPNCPDSELTIIAERLRENIEKLEIEHIDSDCSVSVTVSAGVSSRVPEKGQNWLILFKEADEALYEAKRHGRNRVEKFR